MKAKESKSIKKIKKEVKLLNARIDDMSREMKKLRESTNTVGSKQSTEKPQAQSPVPAPKLSKKMTDTITEAAKEIAGLSE